MPAAMISRKRFRASATLDEVEAGPSTTLRGRRGSNSGSRAKSARIAARASEIPDSDDVFADDEDGNENLFDMTEGDQVPQDLAAPNQHKSTKLVNFECIICMDSATDLTVTHCGHMFCGLCLHQAMHAEVTKKICPMCRQKLESRPKNGQHPTKTAKTFFHLELKLRPARIQGNNSASQAL